MNQKPLSVLAVVATALVAGCTSSTSPGGTADELRQSASFLEGAVCGDKVCDSDESCSSCPRDCGKCTGQHCGDGQCSATKGKRESCATCARDCCAECQVAADCPPSENECLLPVCSGGQCTTAFAASGAPLVSQTAGDCREVQCDGAGGTQSVANDADLPGMTTCGVGACLRTANICADGVPQTCVPGAPTLEVCSDGIDNDCDGAVDETTNCALKSALDAARSRFDQSCDVVCIQTVFGTCVLYYVDDALACEAVRLDLADVGVTLAPIPSATPSVSTLTLWFQTSQAQIDEAIASATSAEICDGCDNDCDGVADNGVCQP